MTWGPLLGSQYVPSPAHEFRIGVLEDVGREGFYDLEIFSDNGTFGSAYPDSLWDLDAAELARRGREAFFNCWSKRRVPATAVGRRGET